MDVSDQVSSDQCFSRTFGVLLLISSNIFVAVKRAITLVFGSEKNVIAIECC